MPLPLIYPVTMGRALSPDVQGRRGPEPVPVPLPARSAAPVYNLPPKQSGGHHSLELSDGDLPGMGSVALSECGFYDL